MCIFLSLEKKSIFLQPNFLAIVGDFGGGSVKEGGGVTFNSLSIRGLPPQTAKWGNYCK